MTETYCSLCQHCSVYYKETETVYECDLNFSTCKLMSDLDKPACMDFTPAISARELLGEICNYR